MALKAFKSSIPASVTEKLASKIIEPILKNTKGEFLSANTEKLQDGYVQKKRVEPKELFIKTNPERIGVFKGPRQTEKQSSSSVKWSQVSVPTKYRDRICYIYQPETRHMQRCPEQKRHNKWVIEFEPWGIFKSPLMNWARGTEDAFYRHTLKFDTLQTAVGFADAAGWGYDLNYPHERWHTRKAYADNFKWRGPAKKDTEEEEF